MADEPLALSTFASPPPAESEYEAICAAVMGSARGRWFLEEYARRNRNADTGLVLAAIARIENVIRGTHDQQPDLSFRVDLLEMARTITQTRAEVAEIEPDRRGRSSRRTRTPCLIDRRRRQTPTSSPPRSASRTWS
jgi:hypothetical protein